MSEPLNLAAWWELVRRADDTENPACCRCDPQLCADDDTGDHCVVRGCAWCIDGCPAAFGDTCCRDAAESTPTGGRDDIR